jgi:hypothetical protein
MPADKPKPQRGLSAIREARELRASRPTPSASGKFWLWALIAITALTIFYWKKTQTDNDANRARILAKQRAVAEEVGPLYKRVRDHVEGWTMETAKGLIQTDFVAPELARSVGEGRSPAILKEAGVYLRVALPNARSPEAIRKASQVSLRDAFTACLLRTPHMTSHAGKACKKSKDCDKGEVCNEIDLCSKPTQPYNFRVAYKGLRVLSDDWVRNVETTDEPLRLRMFETDLNDATANDIPVAIDLLTRAKYFLVVIDEIPEGMKAPDEGMLEQVVQSEVHPTRVALYDLKSEKLLMRMTRTVDVTIPAIPGDASSIDAQRRQILNCALADEARQAMRGDREK